MLLDGDFNKKPFFINELRSCSSLPVTPSEFQDVRNILENCDGNFAETLLRAVQCQRGPPDVRR